MAPNLYKKPGNINNYKMCEINKEEKKGKLNIKPPVTVYIVFVSLLLDLLAFTMILPLLPSLLEHYRLHDKNGLFHQMSTSIKAFQLMVGAPDKFNSVLFGGFLGSMFSFLQFITSPIMGALSDKYGRKPVLLCCLTGIASSYILWALSSNMAWFVLARFVGGLSKGNISLSMAIITDVCDKKTRGRGMALVGIAFSLGFIVGPLIGAMFAHWARKQVGSWFVYPACFAFLLAFLDLLFILFYFKETLPKNKRTKVLMNSFTKVKSLIYVGDLIKFKAVSELNDQDAKKLQRLGIIYFVYLFIYSGLEFTLTFLTHHVFGYTSMQQGYMFFAIGLTMAIIQGGYVRRIPEHRVKTAAVFGLYVIIPSFICVGIASSTTFLYIGVFLFALSTAFVVSCFMTLVSHYGAIEQKGTVMGIFRSLGALARALGPIVASIAFWSIGSSTTYLIGAIGLIWPAYMLHFKV